MPSNSEKRLREAALLVEKWWVEEGQKHFYGAPAGMFYLRAALAALAAEEPAQVCHPAACRDEMLWRKNLAEVRLEEAKEWDTTAHYHISRWPELEWRKKRLAELEAAARAITVLLPLADKIAALAANCAPDCDKCRLESLLDRFDALLARWDRYAKADCDPANGNAMAQAQGRTYAECAANVRAIIGQREASHGE